ncbi:MAG: porin family protein [Bradyrhizobium sp.]|uniref:outer membrane protein n=1 Tax=Bradyrhizobium sp. TaxID=376 RepID=UPI001DC4170F|nr:outer membrane protein [Bradyrhizobium sp.]MBV9564809.1 porin family protein [Bradyrhizobium sp.]
MKKLLLMGVGIAALGMAPAVAADLPARTYTKAPALAPIYNWTGFYVGGFGGYAQEDVSDFPLKGGFGGGTLGYNWQQGQFVYGIEADAAGGDVSVSATAFVPFVGPLTLSDKFNALGTVRGRVGFAVDQWLFYGTGGFAWANEKLSGSLLGVTASDSQLRTGWTAGAGVEVMFAPHWSLKAEYLYRSFGSETIAGVSTGTTNLNSGQVGVNYHF